MEDVVEAQEGKKRKWEGHSLSSLVVASKVALPCAVYKEGVPRTFLCTCGELHAHLENKFHNLSRGDNNSADTGPGLRDTRVKSCPHSSPFPTLSTSENKMGRDQPDHPRDGRPNKTQTLPSLALEDPLSQEILNETHQSPEVTLMTLG